MAEHAMHRAGSRVGSAYGLYLVTLAVAVVGNLVLRMGARDGWFSPTASTALAIASALPLAAVAMLAWRLIHLHLDELQQRIVVEGFTIALAIFIPLAALFVNLTTAGVRLVRLDPVDLLLAPAILVALGLAIAARRYQ